MEIRKAGLQDIDTILSVIDQARQIMRETGNESQWTNGYPSREVISSDINSGNAYVCIGNQEIVGYFYLACGIQVEPTYNEIEGGSWLDDKPYGVIHRLASARKAKGISQAAFDFAFTKIDSVRVDTHKDNLPMQNYLRKNGFTYCGIIYLTDGAARDAFQKVIR
ncbi:MAG: N-acetyltransferase [Flavobacterium sp.]|nr:MAG: N-acetyltransferase [Flavobacterium sp.]